MGTPLRILVVEDSEDDAQLIIRELRRGGYEPAFERVETSNAMNAAIDAGTWDIIVSDYKMPHFSGTAALKLCKEKGLDIPFIMVSGTIGEDIAVEAMVAGVHDYVMKDNLPRLVPAITRELKETEVRRENHLLSDSLKKSEEKYRNIFETATVGIFRSTPEGGLTAVNPALASMHGFASPEELIDQVTNRESDFWVDKEERKRYLHLLTKQDEVRNFETRMFRKDGSILWVSLAAKVFRDANGRPLYHQGATKDITARKQAELRLRENEEAMKSLLNATNDLAFLMDTEGAIIAANAVLAQRLGRQVDDLIGQNIFDLFPKDVAHHRRLWTEKVIESGKPVRIEDRSLHDRYFDSCVYPVFDAEGKVVRLAIYAKDITEAKRASRALAESEARFKQLFDSMNDGISLRDARTFELVDANRSFCEMYGYTLEELKALPLGSLAANDLPAERRRRLSAYYAEVTEGTSTFFYESETKRKDGSTFWVEVNVRRVTIGDRESLLAATRDITERKRAERNQYLSAEILGILNEPQGLPDVINRILVAIKRETGFEAVGIRLNEGDDFPYCVTDGFSEEFVRAERYLCTHDTEGKIVRDGQGNTVLECMCGTILCGRTDAGLPFFTPGGSFWTNSTTHLLASTTEKDRQAGTRNRCNDEGYESVALIPLHSGADIIGLLQLNNRKKDCFTLEMIQFFEGISASIGVALMRKLQEEALRASEERHRTILQTAMDGVWLADTQGRLLEVNDAYCQMSGYSAQELLAMRIPDLEAAETEDNTASRIQKIMAKGEDRFESRHRRKNGSFFDVEVSVQYRPAGGGGLVVFLSDITERKRAEERIRESLKEKEVLLKEIHHRVKNNLQIVSSLLFLQLKRTEHPEAVSALRESRNRIKSMALIHERLYASPDLGSVDMGKYTRKLVSDLRRSHGAEDSSVRLTVTVGDIPLGITEAIPCGLIINELVSNALKHAFPKGRGCHSSERGEREGEARGAGYPLAGGPEGATRVPVVAGEITIQLQRGSAHEITLTVSDNGIGFPEHVDFRQSPSLGLTLINSLVEQLHGTTELDRRGGAAFVITFKVRG